MIYYFAKDIFRFKNFISFTYLIIITYTDISVCDMIVYNQNRDNILYNIILIGFR